MKRLLAIINQLKTEVDGVTQSGLDIRPNDTLGIFKTISKRLQSIMDGLPVDQSITVEVKNVYGMERIYPVCETAETFTDLTGLKTLTRYDLSAIKQLGFKVEQKQVSL